MLDTDTKRCIDSCRDILVGMEPDPQSQCLPLRELPLAALLLPFETGVLGGT